MFRAREARGPLRGRYVVGREPAKYGSVATMPVAAFFWFARADCFLVRGTGALGRGGGAAA